MVAEATTVAVATDDVMQDGVLAACLLRVYSVAADIQQENHPA
jgi:hypothetical protein